MPVLRHTKAQLLAEIATLREQLADQSSSSRACVDLARAEAERYRALFDEAPVAYHELDTEGRICRVNRAEVEMLGYTKEEMLDRYVWEFIGEGEVSRNAVLAKLSGTIPAGHRTERLYTRKDGTVVPVMCEDRLIKGNEGTIVGIRTAIEDITDRKLAEQTSEQLSMLVRQLEEQNDQNTILNEMREFLLACSSTTEIGPVATRAMARLFPESCGALMLLSPSRTDMETVGRWGHHPEDVDENLFAPDACWGLRRGGPYLVENIETGLLCPHVKTRPAGGYLCLPLTAKGDVLGLLHLRRDTRAEHPDAPHALGQIKELASTVAGILSLSVWNMRLRETLANQAIKDPLTGLFNRAFMEDSLQREIYRAGRKQAQISVIMADVDHFKKFNDLHGHAAGDLVLADLAKFLRWKVRAGDIVCRYGGEEFAIIMLESTIDDGHTRAEVLKEGVKELHVSYAGQELGPVTLSMGVSVYPIHGTSPQDLLRAADGALYKAKQAGRDRVMVADPPQRSSEPLPEVIEPAHQ
jgi:diguanylate cyclase (GGDEF)-like protein/PAS domain S-box-containing protein